MNWPSASTAVVDLADAGRLDDAEAAANDLLERFPGVHDGDGSAPLGLIHKIRGNTELAIEYHKRSSPSPTTTRIPTNR